MKLFLILFFVYFLGCGPQSGKHTDINLPKKDTSEKIYTITHAAEDLEDVFVYLQKPLDEFTNEEEREAQWQFVRYQHKIKPGTCLKVSESQFSELAVRVGTVVDSDNWYFVFPFIWSFFEDSNDKTICGGPEDTQKCQPGHYKIIDEGTLVIWDDFVMVEADELSDTSNCEDVSYGWTSNQNLGR